MIDNNKQDEEIKIKLREAEIALKEVIQLSFQAISGAPEKEKELLELWTSHGRRISDYFFDEAERTGNDRVGKNLIKYFMFK